MPLAVFFDFDSTVVDAESLDLMIDRALLGHPDRARIMHEVSSITTLGMEGKIPFAESVRRRIATVPLTKELAQTIGTELEQKIVPGMRRVFAWLVENQLSAYIVSNGFIECIAPAAVTLGVPVNHCLTNQFVYHDGVIVGCEPEPLALLGDGKGTALLHLQKRDGPFAKLVMVGDGMSDYKAYASGIAHSFVAFAGVVARPPVVEKAPHVVYDALELIPLFESIRHTP